MSNEIVKKCPRCGSNNLTADVPMASTSSFYLNDNDEWDFSDFCNGGDDWDNATYTCNDCDNDWEQGEIQKFNKNQQLVYRKAKDGSETWYEYDENGKEISSTSTACDSLKDFLKEGDQKQMAEEKKFGQDDLNKMLFKRCFGLGHNGAETDMDAQPENACDECLQDHPDWWFACNDVVEFRKDIEHKQQDIDVELQ